MLRVVFTVALAVAVLAVAAPAVEQAGVQRSDTAVGATVERLDTAARELAAGNPALPPGSDPARQTVTVEFPDGGFASASLRNFSVGPPPDGRDDVDPTALGPDATRFTWRVAGGTRHARTVDEIRIRPDTTATTRVAGGGEIHFLLELVSVDGERVVRVSRRNG